MGELITIATLLWTPKGHEHDFSRCYTPEWVDRLYRGFARNLSLPFRFVCFSDRDCRFVEPVEQFVDEALGSGGYADCIKPYRLGVPMILVGLDTVIVGNVNHLAEYALAGGVLALPRDPYAPHRACNGVALVPAGMDWIAETHSGQNDMEWLRAKPHVFIDDLWPRQVVSFKGAVRRNGLGDARIVYFHGTPKMQDLTGEAWVRDHWR